MTLFKGISHSYNNKFAICFGNSNYNGTAIVDNYPFNIPDEANFIAFYIVGGGGGGYNGTSSAGGGGGGSGTICSGIFSAKMLPSIIFLCPGSYGQGSPESSPGATAGQPSGVSLVPVTGSILNQNNSVLLGTNGGNNSTSATGASAANVLANSSFHMGSLCLATPLTLAGIGGGNQNGASISFPSNTTPYLFTGGGGGGGNGGQTGTAIQTGGSTGPLWLNTTEIFVPGGSGSSSSANAGNGTAGYTNLVGVEGYKLSLYPLFSTGGAGGGGNSSTGNGGNGGNGAPGCGGGGGGASVSGTPGNGGNGGPGFIIIQWW